MSGGALDSSVTLEEVFTIVGTKRVPLAPELAGYLLLEISEHADPAAATSIPAAYWSATRDGRPRQTQARKRHGGRRGLDTRHAGSPPRGERLADPSPGRRQQAKERWRCPCSPRSSKRRSSLSTGPRVVARWRASPARSSASRWASGATRCRNRRPRPPTRSRRRGVCRSPRLQKRFRRRPRRRPPYRASSASASFPREEEPTTARGQIPRRDPEEGHARAARRERASDDAVRTRGAAPLPAQADVDALMADFGVSAAASGSSSAT